MLQCRQPWYTSSVLSLNVSRRSLVKHNPHLMWCDVWVWASALQPHTHTHSLPLVLVVMTKSKELKTKISHAHSLILSTKIGTEELSLCRSDTKIWFTVCIIFGIMAYHFQKLIIFRSTRTSMSVRASPSSTSTIGMKTITTHWVQISRKCTLGQTVLHISKSLKKPLRIPDVPIHQVGQIRTTSCVSTMFTTPSVSMAL